MLGGQLLDLGEVDRAGVVEVRDAEYLADEMARLATSSPSTSPHETATAS